MIAIIAICGAVGAVARYEFDKFIQDRAHSAVPVGILVINVIGSLILGVFIGLHLQHGLSKSIELAVGTGFCGGFTTFSSLMYDGTQLAQAGAYRQAVEILSLNMILGGIAATIGLAVTGAL
ncbi:MAG: fluoride efflux transporter CrcB [Ilumatobacteraceae bacterium]